MTSSSAWVTLDGCQYPTGSLPDRNRGTSQYHEFLTSRLVDEQILLHERLQMEIKLVARGTLCVRTFPICLDVFLTCTIAERKLHAGSIALVCASSGVILFQPCVFYRIRISTSHAHTRPDLQKVWKLVFWSNVRDPYKYYCHIGIMHWTNVQRPVPRPDSRCSNSRARNILVHVSADMYSRCV